MIRMLNLVAAFITTLIVMPGVLFAQVTDPQDLWASNDIVQLNATISNGILTIQIAERNVLDDFALHFIDIFLDTDQNPNTGDDRIGTVPGIDYRIEGNTGMMTLFFLVKLPQTTDGDEQSRDFSEISGASTVVQGNKLTIKLPTSAIGNRSAVDVFAMAHSGSDAGIQGSGDRCPESGVLATNTGKVAVRQPGVQYDITVNDPTGDNPNSEDLKSVRFVTFDDQFQIVLTFVNQVNPLDIWYNLSGIITLDSDRSLLTGFSGMGDKIATWGGDFDLIFTVCYISPLFQLKYKTTAGSLLSFEPSSNDGRWLAQGNQLIITCSLHIFDAFFYTTDLIKDKFMRRPTDGKMLATVSCYRTMDPQKVDAITNQGHVLDIAAKQILEPYEWQPNITVSENDPAEFGGFVGMDYTRIDAEVIDQKLVLKGVLTQWDASATGIMYEILLDTDMNIATGEIIKNKYVEGEPAIGADYKIYIYPQDELLGISYHADLVRPDLITYEPHDAWLVAKPSSLGPASFTVTIPLESIGNPRSQLRLFLTTANLGEPKYLDVAPSQPMIVSLAGGIGITQSGIHNLPSRFELLQNYPNPFNSVTTIAFSIPENDFVTITIYNILGKAVTELVNGNLSAGEHQVQWDARDLPSGTYFYRMETSKFSRTMKLNLLK